MIWICTLCNHNNILNVIRLKPHHAFTAKIHWTKIEPYTHARYGLHTFIQCDILVSLYIHIFHSLRRTDLSAACTSHIDKCACVFAYVFVWCFEVLFTIKLKILAYSLAKKNGRSKNVCLFIYIKKCNSRFIHRMFTCGLFNKRWVVSY